MQNDSHLGGFVPGGDPATFYPELWTWFVKDLGIKSVLDVGCGDGVAVSHFEKLLGAKNVLGLDGIGQLNPCIVQHDFTKGAYHPSFYPDLVWSCEFVEHIEERYVRNILKTFQYGKYVAMTHAEPGQGGHHHVNCRTADYWIGAMAAADYKLDLDLTNRAREQAAENVSPWNHFKRSGMIFIHQSVVSDKNKL